MSDQNEMLAHKIDEVFHKAAQRYLTLLPGEEKEKGQAYATADRIYMRSLGEIFPSLASILSGRRVRLGLPI